VLSRALAALIVLLSHLSSPAGARASATLRAGAATADLPIPSGVPVAGYGSPTRRLLVPDLLDRYPHAFWFKPSTGVRDPIQARALVLETPAERVLWVAVDLVAVDPELAGDVRARTAAAGHAYSAVIVSASHTHSGPGAYVDSRVFGLLATDRFDVVVRQAVLDGILAAVVRAERNTAPALVGAGTTAAPGLTESRLDRPLDPEIAFLKLVRPGGRPVALVWNYAIHGTTLPPGNLRLSADVMGDASRRLERALGAPALFVNGAVGDVSPRGHGEAAVADLGGKLAAAVRAAWVRAAVADGAELASARRRVDLPAPVVAVRSCLGRWMPEGLAIPLDSVVPRSAELIAVALGPSAWVTIPGELETRLGQAIKAAARRHFRVPFVAGLSNGYLGYLLTADAYRRPGYIQCGSLYGERGGEQVAGAAAALLERLGTRLASRAPRGAGRTRISSGRPCCGGSRPW
jgi:neutral/alkaline ceramidase-like enzyme